MDNAASYFRAMNLTDRAKSFDVVADNISQSIQTISTATKALDRMKELMESAAGQLRKRDFLAGHQREGDTRFLVHVADR